MSHHTHHVGIDVARDHLDIHVLPQGLAFRCRNTPEGVASMLRRVRDVIAADGGAAAANIAFACEATGGHERTLLVELNERDLDVWCLHPADVRAFARLVGTRAKTDPLDARLIAHAAATAAASRPRIRLSRQCIALRELASFRRHLLVQINTIRSQLASATTDLVTRRMKASLTRHEHDLKQINGDIEALIHQDPDCHRKAMQLRAVPGIGPVLTAELIANLPELGTVSSRQIASLVGVAPHPRQSGNSNQGGRCQGGRASLRRTLYMAALSALRMKSHPLKPFHDRLRANGKPAKVAIVAVMRKLITMLNAMFRSDTEWNPKTAPA